MTWPGRGQALSCDQAHEQITLLLYGELGDEEAHRLEQHLSGCAECRDELEVTRALSSAMAILPVREPSPNLLAETRVKLDEALEQAPRDSWFTLLRRSLWTDFRLLRTAPVAAAAMLLAGAGMGGFAGYHAAHPAPAAVRAADPGAQPIAAVTSVTALPEPGMVEVHYNQLSAATAVGPQDDPDIRALLVAGIHVPANPEVQTAAIGMLLHSCSGTHTCEGDPQFRGALMVALRYNPQAEVREAALTGLAPYLADDLHVRDAVLSSALDDTDQRVRADAIRMLAPVSADSSVQQVLQTVAAHDTSPVLRNVSRTVLEQVPQFQ